MKLHLGCGKNVLDGYVNVDKYVTGENIRNMDILKLPWGDEEVDEILAEHVVEHLSFSEEGIFFAEAYRLLKPGGMLSVEVPDIEWVLVEFIKQSDNFIDFYQAGSLDHYFGNGPTSDNRWGILTTHIWGNQNGEGQFHKNGYTEKKIKRIARLIGFSNVVIEHDFKKGTQVLICKFNK